jgi:hypothetical protein
MNFDPQDYKMMRSRLERIAEALENPSRLVLFQRVHRSSYLIEIEKKPTLAVDPRRVVAIEEREHFIYAATDDEALWTKADPAPPTQYTESYSEITLSTGAQYLVYGGLKQIAQELRRELA